MSDTPFRFRAAATGSTGTPDPGKSIMRMPSSIQNNRKGQRMTFRAGWMVSNTITGMLLATVCLLNMSPSMGQSEIVGPAGSSVNRSSAPGSDERVLVLRTGRVMKGRIRTISTGWLVSTDRGNAVIPFQQVHFDADDLNEAYLRLRIQNGRPTVASHLRLAEWCLSQNILAEAARELRDALEKDPANETARLMLDRVDTEIQRRSPKPAETEPAQDVILLTEREPEHQTEEVRSLSGLSPDTAREFVASIQPLLLNKCGNARCHGSAATNEFQLTRLRGGASNSRVVSERNLAAVLRHTQPEQDGASRLMKIVRGSHAGQTIFNGRYGAVQMQTLQQWIKNAVEELNLEIASPEPSVFSATPQTTEPIAVTSSRPSGVSMLLNNEPTEQKAVTHSNDAEFPEPAVARRQAPLLHSERHPFEQRHQLPGSPADSHTATETDSAASPTPLTNVQRLLQQARQHVRKKDEFDPEDFNRRFAGSRTQ